MKIFRLVYGGSFNPVHNGHLQIIKFVLETRVCEELWLVPTYRSPFKKEEYYAPPSLRLALLDLAMKSYVPADLQKKIRLIDWEMQEDRIYYTVDTLRKIEDGEKTGLLLGADSVLFLHLWKEIDWILQHFSIYVVPRSGYEKSHVRSHIQTMQSAHPESVFHWLDFLPPDCASSEIRKKLKEGADYAQLEDCLPPGIYAFLKKQDFFF